MTFDIDMIKKVYAQFPERVEAARELTGRPLTLAEKILNAHLWDGTPNQVFQRGIDYVDFAIENLNIGGCLMVDNVIWGGEVMNSEKLAKPTSGGSRIHRLNQHIANHHQLENVLIPVWDGIQVARKIY